MEYFYRNRFVTRIGALPQMSPSSNKFLYHSLAAGLFVQLYMAGNSISIFTIMILFTSIRDPITSLLQSKKRFMDTFRCVKLS